MSVQFTDDSLPPTNKRERHLPVTVVLDVADGDCFGGEISELNEALAEFKNALFAEHPTLEHPDVMTSISCEL